MGKERLSHTAPRVLLLLRCVGPIMESSFLSLQNIMGSLPCSSLCPPGPVSGTAAVSGAMAWELVKGPPVPVASLPPSPSPAARPSLPAAHTSIHVFLPLLRCCGRIERGTFVYNLSQHRGWCMQELCGALSSYETCASVPALLIPTSHRPCHQGDSWRVAQKLGRGVPQRIPNF